MSKAIPYFTSQSHHPTCTASDRAWLLTTVFLLSFWLYNELNALALLLFCPRLNAFLESNIFRAFVILILLPWCVHFWRLLILISRKSSVKLYFTTKATFQSGSIKLGFPGFAVFVVLIYWALSWDIIIKSLSSLLFWSPFILSLSMKKPKSIISQPYLYAQLCFLGWMIFKVCYFTAGLSFNT